MAIQNIRGAAPAPQNMVDGDTCGERCMDRVYSSIFRKMEERCDYFSQAEAERLVKKCHNCALYGTLATVALGTLFSASGGSQAAIAFYAPATALSGCCCIGSCIGCQTNLIPATMSRIEQAAHRARQRDLRAIELVRQAMVSANALPT